MSLVHRRFFSLRSPFIQQRLPTLQQCRQDPVKLIALPLTKTKSYIFFRYAPEYINTRSLAIKFEIKVARKATELWNKLQKSPKSYNKKIVSSITRLLDNTPWTENALRTVPSESYLLKRVVEQNQERTLSLAEYLKRGSSLTAEPVTLYYPADVLSESQIRANALQMWQTGIKYHKKYTIMSLLGIPLTLPLVLVPVLPNVPGFYLLYRAYCNFKAYCGAKHLESLFSSSHPSRVRFVAISNTEQVFTQPGGQKEAALLTPQNVDPILQALGCEDMKSALEKAIRQESKQVSRQDVSK
ncbi:LAMI_0E11276g1_1 [Lachancea mirantina]|uniref:LAMI_0E11276g1_1 n=1 Tax=Lachancea mirantina TaxID=1230905 RepID=A0A1G4JPG1_9SACH|nr:LAMI_0E11276g1_1 [Lachancea mirantina]